MSKQNTIVARLASFILFVCLPAAAPGQTARDYVYVVGSSTVFPFSTVVAERFGRASRFKTPKVEATGSGGGLKLFCDGIGVEYPDIVNASRRIAESEMASCQRNGVDAIIEVKIGFDGIVIANAVAAPTLVVSRRELYLALAKYVPGTESGQQIPNPHLRWRDVSPALPDLPIEILGPPPTSGTRDAFVELVFEEACRETPWLAALEQTDEAQFHRFCHPVREDGVYVEAGENDNLIVQKLQAAPQAFGVLGFSFLDQNGDRVKGAVIDGESPSFQSIASNEYPMSRPLYFYVKKAHVDVIPGLRDFLREFTSERAWGDDGYLSYRGLVPLSREERVSIAIHVAELRALTLARY